MCGYRSHRRRDYLSDRQDAESADWLRSLPGDGRYLVSDAEREVVLTAVRRHTAAGRLSVAEFSARTDQALLARTADDLRAVLVDLPAPALSPGGAHHVHTGRPRIPALAVVALVITIAMLSGHAWFLFPLMWLAFGFLRPRRRRRRLPEVL